MMRHISKYLITLGKGLAGLFKILGILFIICGVGLFIIKQYKYSHIDIPDNSYLVIDFSDDFSETLTDNLIDEFMERPQMKLKKLIDCITIASTDKRIKGIIARIDQSSLGFAQIQDVARAIILFKEQGKDTIVYSQSFGSLARGNKEYYLATFFDKIYMQPLATIGITGIDIEIPFAQTALNKLGIEAEFYTRYEYKTAMQSFTDKHISPAFKENMTGLGLSLMTSLKEGIEKNRNIKNLDDIINRAPIFTEEGKKLNLIDDTMYLSDLEKLLRDNNIKSYVSVHDYATQIKPYTGNYPVVAYITLDGVIDTGKTITNVNGETTVGSQSVLSDINEIEDIENLKAVIVRINSPGGSYYASDDIYHALQNLKQKKSVPIIISQSSYAASGGYYISLAGDYILAEPTTITGSIGVLGGKFVLSEMWKKLGVNWTSIKFGENSDMLSINQKFTASEEKIFNKSLDMIYNDFIKKVIQNRKLSKNINEIAKGRVWTGQQALSLGLIDAVGGYNEALALAQKMGNIEPQSKIKIKEFPKNKSFSEKLSDFFFKGNVQMELNKLMKSSVNIQYLNLFKRLKYDTVLTPFNVNM